MIERFEKFTRDVSAASKYIAKIKAYEMKRFDLRGGCVMCLFFVGQHPEGLTPTELQKLCAEDKAGISRALSHLREHGYVEMLGEGKKYRAKYRITPSGQNVCDSIRGAISRAVRGAGGELSDEDREIFYRTFETINSNLRMICDAIDECQG